MAYEERYCAFVDILGFSELVADLRTNPWLFETIRGMLKKIRTPHDPEIFGIGSSDFKAQSISDGVVFSTLPTIEGLNVMAAKIRDLSIALLDQGFFTRGAICKGLLHQDDDMVFGEAFIRAHALESTVAKYPRIMIAKDVVDDAKRADPAEWEKLSEHILPSQDGPLHLHVLWQIGMVLQVYSENPSHQGSEHFVKYYQGIGAKIQQKLERAVDTPRHFEKVQWFANYWNQTVDPVSSKFVLHIDGPGLPNYFTPFVDHRIPP